MTALLGWIGACGGTDPSIPTSISLNPSAISFTALGQAQQLLPSVGDQNGKPVLGAEVSWGSSNIGVATVSATGVVTSVGAGSAVITATSGSATATAPVSVVQTPSQLVKVSGDGQAGKTGSPLAAPLVVQVKDAGGTPIPGVTVAFAVTQGDGSIAGSVLTDTDGKASTTFTNGTTSGEPQSVSVTIAATPLSVSFTATATADHAAFNIGLRYLSSATAAQRQAFTHARLRWQNAITADIPDWPIQSSAGFCGPGSPAVNQTIDDVLILISVVAIDGPGGVLGSAGPCYVRSAGDPLPIMGGMHFDTADLQSLEDDGILADVILHEMGHVLGFGTIWDRQGLLAGPSLPPASGTDPHFTGSGAISAFNAAGGSTYTLGAKVPVENTGPPGTRDAHWRESVLGIELMTGYAGGFNPLSRITIASLGDQGYTVNLGAADAFSFAGLLRAFDTRPKVHLKDDILAVPIRKVDRQGRVTGEVRR